MTARELLRFEAKLVREPMSGCWIWTAASTPHGYGCFTVSGRQRLAHRASFEHFIGEIPAGLQLDHLCRVRSCVNPAHLEPVTCAENIRRGETGQVSKRRALARTHCRNGHPYNEENTYITKRGARACRVCHRESGARQRATESYRARRRAYMRTYRQRGLV